MNLEALVMARLDREASDYEVDNLFTDTAGDAPEQTATVFSRLPGVVNDLPEVAPHEWIYIMS